LRLEKQQVAAQRQEPDRPVWVFADESQLVQVVVNIVLNAVDAMPHGGRLELRLHEDGGQAHLAIRDTGVGIPREYLDKIFDPFFTTKEPGRGTGLGLAVSHGIVSEHGGSIDVDSIPGTGTVMTVRLPLAEAAADQG
jgi:signal transduction histidine kinase